MFNEFIAALEGSGSMVERYLQLIALLDKAEDLAVSLAKEGLLSPGEVLSVSHLKQDMIEQFAKANLKTGDSILEELAEISK